MGTTIILGSTFEDLIAERIGSNMTHPCLHHQLVMDFKDECSNSSPCPVLWTVRQAPSGRLSICCDVIFEREDGWGFKDFTESEHPFYYSCPLAFLDIVPDSSKGADLRWRARVREYAREVSVAEPC